MFMVVFILLSPNKIMIWLSLKREKWVYEYSKRLFTVVPVEKYNKKPSYRRDTEVKQGGLENFPVPAGNLFQTFIIIMCLFHLLKERLNMQIITALLIWIDTILHINFIDPLKSTKIFLVG